MAGVKYTLGSASVATETTWGAAPSAGGALYSFLKTEEPTWQPTADVNERAGFTTDLTRQAHTMGVKGGTLSFKTEIKASGTPAGDSTSAIASESSPLLESVLGV